MSWFYTSILGLTIIFSEFKYILCLGSTSPASFADTGCHDLNTSYVLVLLDVNSKDGSNSTYLNTSYVLVLPLTKNGIKTSEADLNTSYVLVLPQYQQV